MSTRTSLAPKVVLPSSQSSPANSTDMSLTLVSAPTIIGTLSRITYQFVWSGTSPVGTLSVEMSQDYDTSATGIVSGGNWNAVPVNIGGQSLTAIPVTGNTGQGTLDLEGIGGGAIRARYVPTSGTGALRAVVKGGVS